MGKRLNLKAFRIKKDLTQAEMAEMLGVNRTTYAAIEQGARRGTEDVWHTLKNTFDVPDAEMYSLMSKED